MNALMTGLGIPEEFQALFKLDSLVFDYGDAIEHFGQDFHLIPTTKNLWVAGDATASEVIITSSAMEAIAFLTIHRQRYPKPGQLTFISIGNKLQDEQLEWVRSTYTKRKFTLVFGNDYIGRLTDIKIAAGLKSKPISIYYYGQQTIIRSGAAEKTFSNQEASLYAFERAFGWRSGIRCRKPINHNNFLDELKNGTR
jgi:hypothetical protein